MHSAVKLTAIWLAPFLLGPIYALIMMALHFVFPHLVGTPTIREVFSVVILELFSSPLWVGVGFVFTYIFGGIVVVYVVQALASIKILKPKFVISGKDKKGFEEVIPENKNTSFFNVITTKSFGLCLALALSINLVYTLTIQRYFQDLVTLPQGSTARLYHYLLSPKLILSDYALALLFLPIITFVVPLFIGKISIRQIDAARFDIYWLSFAYSIAGGASLILFLIDVFETKGGTELFVVAILFVYGILSWYTALGISMCLPHAEKKLASELLRLKDSKDLNRNIIFGQIYAEPTKEEADKV